MPRVTVKCIVCMHEFPQKKNAPGKHDERSEVVDGKQMYNTRCPDCGNLNRMSEDYAGVPDDILERVKERVRNDDYPNHQHLIDFQNGDITEDELREKI